MKSLLSIFLVVFLSKGCSQEAQDLASVKIVYGANTRGFHRTIQIENKTFSVTYERDAKPVILPITNEEWNKIAELYAKIDLKNFNNLEGPMPICRLVPQSKHTILKDLIIPFRQRKSKNL